MRTFRIQISILLIMVSLLTTVIVSSCEKDKVTITSFGLQPNVGVPLAYGNLSLMNLITAVDSSGFIKSYADSSLYFDYTANLFTKMAGQVISLPNQAFSEVFSSPDVGFPIPSGGIIQFTRNSDYPCTFPNGAILDTVNFKSGTLTFNVTSTFPDLGSIVITMPSFTKKGVPFQQTITINSATGNFSTISNNDISGYSLRDSVVGGVPNQIPITYKITINSATTPPASENISIGIGLTNLAFASLYGYIGQIPILDTLGVFKFNFFNNFSTSNLVFADPRFHLYFANSFGIPLSSTLLNVYAQSIKTQTNENLFFNASINPFNIKYPGLINQIARDTLIIDSTSCPNLPAALAIYPQYLYYGIGAITNPSGLTHNFVTDSSQLSVNLGIEMPFNLKVGQYVLYDTINFNASKKGGGDAFSIGAQGDTIINDIKQVVINCSFLNGMPLDLNTQVFLCDSLLNKLDSLFTYTEQPIVKSAAVSNSGKVTTPAQTNLSIVYNTAARIQKLKSVKKAIIKSIVSTTGKGQKFVKFYSYYRLSVKFSAEVSLKITQKL